MTFPEFKQGINILLDAWLTDPTAWDNLSKQYQDRMMNNYDRYFSQKNAKQFIRACRDNAKSMKKFPTVQELIEWYQQTQVESEVTDFSNLKSMPDSVKEKMEELDKAVEHRKEAIDDDLPF